MLPDGLLQVGRYAAKALVSRVRAEPLAVGQVVATDLGMASAVAGAVAVAQVTQGFAADAFTQLSGCLAGGLLVAASVPSRVTADAAKARLHALHMEGLQDVSLMGQARHPYRSGRAFFEGLAQLPADERKAVLKAWSHNATLAGVAVASLVAAHLLQQGGFQLGLQDVGGGAAGALGSLVLLDAKAHLSRVRSWRAARSAPPEGDEPKGP